MGLFFQMDAEKLISWGSRANIIKRYGFEEHTLRSGWVGACVYYLLYCTVCVWALYSAGGKLCACVSLCCLRVCVCVCTLDEFRLRLIIECVRVCVCVSSLHSRAHYLCMCWC